MAIKCSAEITATNQIDATDLIMWYYATTLTTKPLSPSTTSASITPTGWSLIEPTIASASDLSKYIYECLQIVWGDGTCSWGDVQLSASFEAAKQAYNLAHSTASIFTTFEQTHNKTLVDTVNESSSAITTLTESHQYGGINLLSNTKSIDSLSVPYTNSNISLYSNQAPIDGESFYYCSGPKYFQIDFPTLINNQKYTLSFDISRSSNSQPVFVKIDGTETNIGTAATTWTRLSHTFIASASTTNAQIRVAFDSTSSTATYIAAIRHIKLEQGSLATPWEYSSNDISTLSNTVNTVSQTVDSNNSTISNLTQTLGTNANGTTKTDDIVHQVSDISQDLNGITTRVGKTEIALKGNYAISSTAKGTANKQATISPTLANYELVQGAAITVKFATENTAANPTLNINSTGAKPIKTYSGAALSENEYKWDAGSTMTFVYDGTNWCIQDSTELTRIKNNETLINQTANNILIKATESDTTAAQGGQHLIQSLINVAPNGIKISADKVDIEGAAIFSENGYLSQDNINAINNESQTIYIQAVSGTSSISGTTTWVTNTGESVTQDAANLTPVWTLKRPIYRTKYPVLFVATQYKTIDGTITCTTPLKDDTITVIDAGHITTGTIDASNITVTNLNADNITTGTINGQRIGVGSLSLDKLAEDVYTETEVDNIVDNLQTQIDGAIETWTGTAIPTLNNAPASGWTTNAIKDTHVGDVYFVVNSQSQQNGYNYRFTKSGGTYSWQLIKDNDVTNALQRLETAEGKITSIESFDSTVSSFMTNTDSELTSVKSRATSLETRMTDAEGDISEKVDTSTFNTLSQTVDGNSASITSMGTVLTNNGLTSSTNITNTVNTVSQTASGNNSKISQLTTTLGTNADGTTKAGDVVHRTSAIEQDVSSFKTTVSETYTTKEEFENLEIGGRNLLPTVEVWENGTWNSATGVHSNRNTRIRSSKDGWYITIEPSETYVLSRHSTSDSKTYHAVLYAYDSSGSYVSTDSVTAWITEFPYSYEPKTATRLEVGIRNSEDGVIEVSEVSIARFKLEKGNKATDWTPAPEDIETRVSSAESSIIQNANNIALKVSKDGVISSINQSAETVKIQASRVEIDGTAVFNAIKSSTDAAYDSNGAASTALIDAKAYADNAESRIVSRGEQLVINGNGFMGDNTNFSQLIYDPTVCMNGSAGSFTKPQGYNGTIFTNIMFPVDPKKKYVFSFDAVSSGNEIPRFYSFVQMLDIDKKDIQHWMVHYRPGTITELARPVANGDTEVYVVDASNWNWSSVARGFLMFGYKNSKGYEYPSGYYTRWATASNVIASQDSIDKETGKITLSTPWSVGAYPAGTKVAQRFDGNGYVYVAATNAQCPQEATHFEGTIGPEYYNPEADESSPKKFRNGTAYANIGFLWNYNKSDSQMWVTNVSMREKRVESDDAVSRTQRIWYRKSASGAPSTPGTASSNWVTKADDGDNAWTKMHVAISNSAKYIYTCEQYEMADGTVGYTDVLLDNTITVIDGGNIITGSVTANKLNASDINASKTLTVGAMTDAAAATILNSNISVGGRNLFASSLTSNGYPADNAIGAQYSINGMSSQHEVYQLVPVEEGASYVFQYWVDNSEHPGWICIQLLDPEGIVVEKPARISLNTDYLVRTFTIPSGVTTALVSGRHLAAGYEYAKLKLEKGNVATDWTPAPEDMASSTDSVEFILGTQTAATGSWTGVTRDSSLYTGKTIAYKLPYAGSGSASLQLKDSSGNNVGGNIAVYSMTTRVTTHYPAGSVIQMTYDGTYWRTAGWYNSNNYDRNLHNNYVKAAANVVSGQLVCGTSAGYKPIAASTTFDMSYPILWASGTWISGKQYINAYETYPSVNPATTATVQDIAVNKMVYVKGQISGNTFTCAASNFLTCIVPTSEDGYFYLPVGIVANDATTKMYFNTSNDLYAYLDGKFRQVTPTEIMASQRIYYRSKVSGTVPKPTAWVTFATNQYNDTVSVGNGGWSTKVTPIAASKAENVDKYLYLYTCEQRKRLDGTVECTDVTLDENTTIIDGGNIITHTVTAEQLNATSINASKSLTVGAMTDTAAATILNSNINVGGRNLLPMSDRLGASGTSSHGLSWSFGDDGWIALSGTIDTTSSFAPVFWGHTVSESAPDYTWPAGTYTFTLETTGTPLVYGLVRVQVYVESGASQYLDGAGTVTFTATNGIQRIGLYVNANADGETVNGALRYKLEKGTMSTDWTPAPEDTNDAIVNVASDISESLENMDGTLNDFANTLEKQSTDIGESINEVQDQLNALREDFESEVNAREQWLSFNSSEGLVIGENESNFKTVTTATSMEFRNGDTVLARAAGEEFSVPSLRSEELHLGNWMWIPRSNGNLALKWIGE